MIGAARARASRAGSADSMILQFQTRVVSIAATVSSTIKKGWTNVQFGLEYVLFSAVRRDPLWEG